MEDLDLKKKINVRSSLKRLGSAVAKDFLLAQEIPIKDDWSLAKCLKFVIGNKEYFDKVYNALNS